MTERETGLYVATVESTKLDQDGCIGVRIPAVGGSFAARFVTFMAGAKRGALLLPELGDQVLVARVIGSDAQWAVVGTMWSRNEKPVETNSNGDNDLKIIRTRGGSVVRFVDTDQDEKIEIVDKTGSNRISIQTRTRTVTIEAADAIKLTANTITIEAKNGDLILKGGPMVKIN